MGGEDSGVGMMADDSGVWSGMSSDTSVRVRLLFYGPGLLLWSCTVLGLFSSRLQ